MTAPRLVYLHGFVSSPASRKAQQLVAWMAANAPAIEVRVPALHHDPRVALGEARAACEGIDPTRLTVVGSSLGGFYATVIAEATGCRAALLNPAVHPQRLFEKHLGPHENLHTGERFELTREHVAALAAMDPPAITHPGRYWLIAEKGDEVLDWRDAAAYFAGARQSLVEGGDHALASFSDFLPGLADFARAPAEATT
ncbi:MAG TPA: YqiA/YcfP family alpha/beta fold hydrolase [Usitatibacteraceae bacterium]|nr:YqiA/YcfP family alpha/beta fold hydrolase [Usitatibacteraceae bacterium]